MKPGAWRCPHCWHVFTTAGTHVRVCCLCDSREDLLPPVEGALEPEQAAML